MNVKKAKKLALKEAKDVNAFSCNANISDPDLFQFYPFVFNEYELGYYVINNLKCFHEWKHNNYIDYERLGISISKISDGLFTEYGFIFLKDKESFFAQFNNPF